MIKGQESLENWHKNWQLKEFEEALRHDIILCNDSNNFQEDLEKSKPQYLHAEGLSLVNVKILKMYYSDEMV